MSLFSYSEPIDWELTVARSGWAGTMRAFIVASLLLVCVSVQAAHLDYFSCRKWVEARCMSNSAPQDGQLFIGRMVSPRFAKIFPFHKGIALREIIDQTPLKGKVVWVCVMRPDYLKTGPFTRHVYIRVAPSDTPDFGLQSEDVIWLFDDEPVIDI